MDVVYGGHVLAGILIAIVVVVGLACALPWVTSQRSTDLELEGDPTERFSDSIRILRRDVIEYNDDDISSVSTPLTRRAQLDELRMTAKHAAKRRRTVVFVLLGALAVLGTLAGFSIVPWWSLAIPGGLLVGFLGLARFTVVQMHRRLDARAAALKTGFDEDEDTVAIDLTDREETENVEISIDLTATTSTMGALWDPIPVTPATYVSQPLLPRTVRTIDLSAPVVASTPLIPTADHPSDVAVDEESIREHHNPLRRAVGE